MLNSLLATFDASQRLWNRSRSSPEGSGGAIISIPMSSIHRHRTNVIDLDTENPGVGLGRVNKDGGPGASDSCEDPAHEHVVLQIAHSDDLETGYGSTCVSNISPHRSLA